MIFSFIIIAVLYLFSLFLAPFPTVTELPWGVDSFFSNGMGYYRQLMVYLPPLSTVLDAFLIYIGFRLSIIILRFFLGSRTPTHT